MAALIAAIVAAKAGDGTTVRLVLVGLAIALLALPLVATERLRISRTRQTQLLAILALAAWGHASALQIWQLTTSPWVRVWNVFHYYLGAEYFEELGFVELYDAALEADKQGDDYWNNITEVRNLRTYEVEPRSVGEARFDPAEVFTPQRWEEFRADVAALQVHRSPDRWKNIFIDRGYNPPPFWTFVGQRLTALLPATSLVSLKLLVSLDLLLMAAIFWLIRRTFGLRPAVLVFLFIALSPVNGNRLAGGFLQYDWFCAIAAAICFVKREKPIASAACLAYAVLTRVFPAVLVAAALVPVVVFWVRTGRIRQFQLRFFVALGLFGLVGLGLGSLTGRGPTAWVEFTSNIGHHSEAHTWGQRRVGLKHWFIHDQRSFAFDEGGRERRAIFAQQLPLYQGTAALGFAAFALVAYRRRRQDALLLGLVPFFLIAVSSRYYWAVLALVPLLRAPGAPGHRQRDRLALAQAGIYGAFYAFEFFRPSPFGAYSILNLSITAFLTWMMAGFLIREVRARKRLRERRGLPWFHSGALRIGFFALLFVVLCLLRMPHQDRPIRDVDESVSAIIATTWLEGGIPYRDAIDQRGPVTYLLYALTFLVAGANNMYAVHWLLLLLILVSAWVVFQLAKELRPGPSGWAMAFVAAAFLTIATYTYKRSQLLAFHTEWPGMLASAIGMLLLWRGIHRQRTRELWLSGISFGAAFLSKQPAVFDGAAAGIFLLLLAWSRGRLFHKDHFVTTLKHAVALAGGFFAAVLACAAYFAAYGALGDFYLYYWQYNVEHYTAVVPLRDKLSALNPWDHSRHYLRSNPLLFVAGTLSCLAALKASLGASLHKRSLDGRFLLFLWLLFSYFGASYSGRNFGHYFIQILPPLCLLSAWFVVDLWQKAREFAPSRLGTWIFREALVWVLILGLGSSVYRYRRDIALTNIWQPARTKVERQGLLDYIRATTDSEDTIFVWGYNPEIYMLTPRRSATRYSNTNYLTGMLPWENHRPGVDTSEHIVEGAWDILFEELDANPPSLIIDTVPGNHRAYIKYPIEKFPRLEGYLQEHYQRTAIIPDRKGQPYYQVYRREL
ncbi:MAG: glycosyltransferase family 39 protein [Deltaproteobacteria bacterium]|nr:glycosyltransferase family 39 protein [Deltaproteobacteria bacterium]